MESKARPSEIVASGGGAGHSPLVSVVVPTHNRVTETLRAVASALLQTLQDIEVIVVDDGSQNPHSLELCLKGLDDDRIKFIALSANHGANRARNIGVNLARGAYVAFLDSDDEWLPGKLEAQLALLQDSPPNTVCSCRVIALSTVSERTVSVIIPVRIIQHGDRVGDYLFCRRGALVTPSLMLPRALALKYPFDESLRRHQEFGYLLRLCAVGAEFRFVTEPLVVVHWESLSSSGRHIRPQLSSDFLDLYGETMSGAAMCGFWYRNVVVPLLIASRYREAVRAIAARKQLSFYLIFMPRLAAQVGVLLLGVPPRIVQALPHAIRRVVRSVGI